MCAKMTRERAEEFGAAWNSGDADLVTSFFAENGVYHASVGPDALGESYVGKDSIRRGVQAFFDRYPDGKFENLKVVVADDIGTFEWDFVLVQDLFHVRERSLQNFRTGKGMEWGEHHPCLFCGTERFFRAGYNAHLLSSWIPALDGVEEKLKKGGKAADVGCGHGASTILLAKAFPKSDFVGYDYHGPSIETATQRAKDAGVVNARFEVADATAFHGKDFDLIAFFDCLHDMAEPVGAARHALGALKAEGTCMLVEPFAGDAIADNLNPVGRMFYGASTLVCVPVSLARNGPALGAQAGETRLQEIMVDQGGFSTMRRATETPFNIVLEARP